MDKDKILQDLFQQLQIFNDKTNMLKEQGLYDSVCNKTEIKIFIGQLNAHYVGFTPQRLKYQPEEYLQRVLKICNNAIKALDEYTPTPPQPQKKSNRGGQRNGAGRKALGITKKISLTLSESEWTFLKEQSNMSAYLREKIVKDLKREQKKRSL